MSYQNTPEEDAWAAEFLGNLADRWDVDSFDEPDDSTIVDFEDEDDTMVDLGGGMVVPLRELMEDDE